MAASSSSTSFSPSPIASTRPASSPAASQSARTPTHFNNPAQHHRDAVPAVEVVGDVGLPDLLTDGANASSDAWVWPSNPNMNTGSVATTSSSSERPPLRAEAGGVSGCVDGSGPRYTS